MKGILRTFDVHYGERLPGYPRLKRAVNAALVAPEAIAVRRRYPTPRLVLGYFGGIGDEVLLTVVTRELRRRGYDGTWVMSEHPDVWRHNPDPDVVLPWGKRHYRWTELFRWNVVFPYYTHYLSWGARDASPAKHILTLMCERTGIVGPIARKPHVVLTDDERERGARVPDQIAIQSAGLDARYSMLTKQWFPERFQAVVDALKHEYNFVQVGSRYDPPLDGALDLRGQTSIRETAGILSRSVAFVGQVSMLMHLARGVDCRSVIVYGGREHPEQTGYACNENLYTPVPCSPCWKLNTCGHEMACMRAIQPDDVVAAVRRQAARYGQMLPVDVDVISARGVPTRRTPDGRTLLKIPDVMGQPREIEGKFLDVNEEPPRAGIAA